MVDAGRLDSRTLRNSLRPTPVHVILQALHRLYDQQAQRKQIQLKLSVEPALPMVLADASCLERIVENLLSNAIKYTHSGGCVQISASMDSGSVICLVEDNGPGIPHEEKHLLFRRYCKLTPRPTANEPSSGLGLAIAKQLSEDMAARLWYEPAEAGGARFCLALKTSPN
jgi:signal transduction histidine kinase